MEALIWSRRRGGQRCLLASAYGERTSRFDSMLMIDAPIPDAVDGPAPD